MQMKVQQLLWRFCEHLIDYQDACQTQLQPAEHKDFQHQLNNQQVARLREQNQTYRREAGRRWTEEEHRGDLQSRHAYENIQIRYTDDEAQEAHRGETPRRHTEQTHKKRDAQRRCKQCQDNEAAYKANTKKRAIQRGHTQRSNTQGLR